MHEWSTAREIAAKVIESGRGASEITRIRIHLGQGSHLTANTFRDRLEMLFAGTNAQGATIAIDRSDTGDADVRLESIDVEA